MNIIEKIGKNNSFVIVLEDYYGSGWVNYIYQATENKIVPDRFEKEEIEVSWDYSEYILLFEKDGLKVKIEIDDLGPVSFILKENITQENKQKLREWATIIAEEVEKIKK
ncbi:MAG: hypothetical protein H3C39_02805 [Flavobacteriia bacterium]|nr:hypothetical protein [Flavobacteriia bacterium]